MKKIRFHRASIGKTVEELSNLLVSVSETPALDAQVLVAFLFNQPRSWIISHKNEKMAGEQLALLEDTAPRLLAGEPLPYVIGKKEFFGIEFMVTQDVLIPRPETELLVEHAIDFLRTKGKNILPWKVIDLGTGSGCIAISLSVHVQELKLIATDISPKALNIAEKNAGKLNVQSLIQFVQADLFNNPVINSQFQLILSNPPYIPTDILSGLPALKQEPILALDGGVDGLEIIRRILFSAKSRLTSNGLLLLEIESSQGSRVKSLAEEAFPSASITINKDLAGRDRLLRVER